LQNYNESSSVQVFYIRLSIFCNFEAFKNAMRKNKTFSIFIILSGLVLLIYSCTPESCYEDTKTLLNATFYDYDTKESTKPDTLTLSGLNNDSIIYDNESDIQPCLFPLNSATDYCSFKININGITDTIEFNYYSFPHLVSKECGYTYYHNLDSIIGYTTNIIDSISISKENITTINEENIRIYY
jgi:Family of unknown function (DUF6452)